MFSDERMREGEQEGDVKIVGGTVFYCDSGDPRHWFPNCRHGFC